jgi:hypothetical protein
MRAKKDSGPYVLLLSPTCPGCGQLLMGFGTPQGPRCPFEITGGGCTALSKLQKKARRR